MVNLSLNIKPAIGTELYRTIVGNGGKYEPEVFAVVLHLLENARDAFFLNVGSNIGLFPLAAAKLRPSKVGQIDVYAHEPLPYLQDVSRALKAENGIDYNLSSLALSDFTGTADFFVSAKSDASNSLVKDFRPAKEVINVEVDTLDNLYLQTIESKKFDEVLIVVDVETAEPSVLRGGIHFMRAARPIIICEVLAGRTEKELAQIMLEADYAAYSFDGNQWAIQNELRGDKSYKHRDLIFMPSERARIIGNSFRAAASHRVSFSY